MHFYTLEWPDPQLHQLALGDRESLPGSLRAAAEELAPGSVSAVRTRLVNGQRPPSTAPGHHQWMRTRMPGVRESVCDGQYVSGWPPVLLLCRHHRWCHRARQSPWWVSPSSAMLVACPGNLSSVVNLSLIACNRSLADFMRINFTTHVRKSMSETR